MAGFVRMRVHRIKVGRSGHDLLRRRSAGVLLAICYLFITCAFSHVMHLKGGGKFPLMRMVRHEMNMMDRGNKLAIYDKIHKALPFLDEMNDPETRELKR
jgi:hypothetical protein